MPSKTSYFSPIIYKKNLSRFYLLAILYTIAVCIALPMSLHVMLDRMQTNFTSAYYSDVLDKYSYLMEYSVEAIYTSSYAMGYISFFGAIAAAMAVFSYLYRSSSANMIASLPIRREAVFISSIASIFTVVILANALACLLAFAVTLPHGLTLGKWIMDWFLISIMQFTLFFGIAAFCAVITGSIVMLPLIYGVVNFVSIGLVGTITTCMNGVLFGVQINIPEIAEYLSPASILLGRSQHYSFKPGILNPTYADYEYTSWGYLIAFFIAGLIIMAIALVLIRRRHMETAGDVISFKILRYVFKIIFTLCSAYIGALIFFSIFFSYDAQEYTHILVATIAVFGFIGYIISDMIVNKRSKIVARKVLPVALASAVLTSGFIMLTDMDVFGLEKYVPETSEVKSVRFYVSGRTTMNGAVFNSEDTAIIEAVTNIHDSIIDNREFSENRPDSSSNWTNEYVYIDYLLENGDYINRRYEVYDIANVDTGFDIIRDFINSDAYIQYGIQNIPEITTDSIDNADINYQINVDNSSGNESSYRTLDLSIEEAHELYTQCILPDIVDGNLGQSTIGVYENYDTEYYNCYISFSVSKIADLSEYDAEQIEYILDHNDGRLHYDLSLILTQDAERTIKWIEDRGIELLELDY